MVIANRNLLPYIKDSDFLSCKCYEIATTHFNAVYATNQFLLQKVQALKAGLIERQLFPENRILKSPRFSDGGHELNRIFTVSHSSRE